VRHYFGALFVAAALPAFAAPATWIKVTSPHFELYTTAGERRGREAVQYFEQVREQFLRLRSTHTATKRIRIVAFSSKKEFEPYQPNEFTPAFYLGGDGHDYIVMSALGTENFPMAVHEYSHLWLKYTGIDLPIWLNEGLAEIHSTLQQNGNRVGMGHPIPGRLQVLRDQKWLPLARVILVRHGDPEYSEKNRATAFYAQSWLLAHMLYLSDEFRPKWSEFVRGLLENGSAEHAFRVAYGKSVEEIEKALHRYAAGAGMNAMFFPGRLEKPSDAPGVAPASPLESGIVLAELLGFMQRYDRAERIYDELAQQYPQEARVAESRGLIAWQNRQLDAAKKHYGHALELKSGNAKMLVDFGKLVYNDDPDKAVVALERAVELDASEREAHEMLGSLLFNKRDFAGAAKHLLALKEIKADRAFQTYSMLAWAQYETGNKEGAKLNAERARKFARGTVEVDRADELLRFVSDSPRPQPQPNATTVQADEPGADPKLNRRTEAGQVRSGEPRVYHQEPRESLAGTLHQLDCLGAAARIHVRSGPRRLTFVIKDPGQVLIKSATGGATMDFTCGPQKPQQVTVEYVPAPDGKLGTAGVVRVLEFSE
jgi:tetratricopeptide (TPR) repeat protein